MAGSMGYGLPAAVGIKRLYPDRTVLCVAGDGDFLMNGQEFATAVQYDLPIVVIIMDNGTYGTIRMHQEREYPTRVIGTDLRNPDFAAYARAFGGFGVTVERTGDFPAAFKAARESGKPSIIHLKVDPQSLQLSADLKADGFEFTIGTDRLGNFRVTRAINDGVEMTTSSAHAFELSEFRVRSALETFLQEHEADHG